MSAKNKIHLNESECKEISVGKFELIHTEEIFAKFDSETPLSAVQYTAQCIDVIYQYIKVANEFPNQIIKYPQQGNLRNTYAHLQTHT